MDVSQSARGGGSTSTGGFTIQWNDVPYKCEKANSGALMSLAGKGAIAIWNDITNEGRANFYEWHGWEHIPERLRIPGFLRGRRYAAIAGAPEYFTFYETVDVAAFRDAHYTERLDDPTPWTLKSTLEFRNVARALCHVDFSQGLGQGALMATWRYHLKGDALARHRVFLAREALPHILTRNGVAGCHLLLTDADASRADNAERRHRGTPNEVPTCILMIEGWTDEDRFQSLCEELNGEFKISAWSTEQREFGLYKIQYTADRFQVPADRAEAI